MTYRILDRNDPDFKGDIFGPNQLAEAQKLLKAVKPLADMVGVDFYINEINTP